MDPFIAPELQSPETTQDAGSDPFVDPTLQSAPVPQDVNQAAQLGKDPRSVKYNGMCLQFVDDVLNTPPQNRAPSASASWNNYLNQGQAVQGTAGLQAGDIIYFDDPNDPDGHVGFYSGKGNFISATEENPEKPVQNHSLKGWMDLTGQKLLGYVKNPENLPQIGGQGE